MSDFVDFRSIRMKVILLIVFWAGVMLTGQLANGILSAMNTGDAELLHQVATLRSLPQNMSRDAIGIIQNAEDVSHFPTLRIAIKGYSETLSKFEPSIEKGSNPKTLLFPRDALRQKLMESKLEERRIRRAVEQLKDEWEKHRPLFEGVMSDEERPEIVAINDAVDDLIIQSDRLSSVINLTVNERLTFINWINLAVIICGLFAAGLVFRTLHRIILIPLENLKNATARFADNDMTAR
ncbi:MAG: hypothetical protein JKX97_01100, partial [Candidatus Lindowbacteria bacterium]|nr:hypothetical protein [Candidatus Lindowbacteria bacterium]